MIKEIIIKIVHTEGADPPENITVDTTNIAWAEIVGYLEKAKAIIVNSDR